MKQVKTKLSPGAKRKKVTPGKKDPIYQEAVQKLPISKSQQ